MSIENIREGFDRFELLTEKYVGGVKWYSSFQKIKESALKSSLSDQ